MFQLKLLDRRWSHILQKPVSFASSWFNTKLTLERVAPYVVSTTYELNCFTCLNCFGYIFFLLFLRTFLKHGCIQSISLSSCFGLFFFFVRGTGWDCSAFDKGVGMKVTRAFLLLW